MTIRVSDEDEKKLDEIQRWLVLDSAHNIVFREDTPPEILAEQKRLAKKTSRLTSHDAPAP